MGWYVTPQNVTIDPKCNIEVLFENHIFYEKVSSIKMIIILINAKCNNF